MKVYSKLNLEHGSVANFNFEDQSNYPLSPKVGSCIMKDKRVMLCVDMNTLPVWIPLTQEMGMYTHKQTTAKSRWEFRHGLNVGRPMVQVFDDSGDVILPDNIRILDANNIEVLLPGPMTGAAVVIAGTEGGLPHQDFAFDMEFTEASATWEVPHALGYVPGIRVYINNYEVQPKDIVHNGTTSTTITFDTPQVGRVVCI